LSGPVWIDGASGDRIEPTDRGLTLGDGVFDTLVAFGGVPFAGERHLARLVAQAAAIGMSVAPDHIRSGWAAVLAEARPAPAILRTTVTRGVAARGLWPVESPRPTLIVAASPWSRQLLGAPVRLVTSTIRRNPASPSARLKALGYLDHVLAAREAAEKGADDALFLTPAGRVACSTIANIFALRADRLSTPPESDGVMPGVMRALVLKKAASLGLAAGERSLALADLIAADAVFLTNSVRFLAPVVALDGAALANRGGAVVAALQQAVLAEAERECGVAPEGKLRPAETDAA